MQKERNQAVTGSYICCSLVIAVHLLALFIYLSPALSAGIKYVPYTMAVLLVLIMINQPDKSARFWLFLLLCFSLSFLTELFSLTTGMVFGDYRYGDTLGPKLAGVPLLMGVFWVVISYSAGAFVKNFHIKGHTARALYGALFMLLLEILIEPIAIKFNYWDWVSMIVPLQKYAAVFCFGFILLRILYHSPFKKRNPAATMVFIMQVLFYAALNLWAF
ncbi:MAG: carotenoid biosynthesis protein [Sphingobacteriaceae bacterium]|nr:carotenoid biosynthesis protein [Sphingobacteriaceae bacterium]